MSAREESGEKSWGLWIDEVEYDVPNVVREFYINKGLEAAAKVCDGYPQRDPAEDRDGYWAAEECAEAIRNLMDE